MYEGPSNFMLVLSVAVIVSVSNLRTIGETVEQYMNKMHEKYGILLRSSSMVVHWDMGGLYWVGHTLVQILYEFSDMGVSYGMLGFLV